MEKEHEKDIDPKDLPQSEVFREKEVFQHPQPADWGQPLKPKDDKEKPPLSENSKEAEKTSKEEGLNESMSEGNAGAFEGFEDESLNS